MPTFGIKIRHLNPRLYKRIYCVILGVEMSPIPHVYSSNQLYTIYCIVCSVYCILYSVLCILYRIGLKEKCAINALSCYT